MPRAESLQEILGNIVDSAKDITYPGGRLPEEDICGFCDQPGADKIPHPIKWPGEQSAGTEYVHAKCEFVESCRAHSELTDKERELFLRTL